jgi:hypothetical protein
MSDDQQIEAVARALIENAEPHPDDGNPIRQQARAVLAALDDACDAEIKRLRGVLERIARTGEAGASDQHAPDMWEACRTWACDALNGAQP